MNKQNKTPYTYVCNSVKWILKNLEGKWGNAEISRIPVNVHFFSISLSFADVCSVSATNMYYHSRQGPLFQAAETDSGCLQSAGQVGRWEIQGRLDIAVGSIPSASGGHLSFFL